MLLLVILFVFHCHGNQVGEFTDDRHSSRLRTLVSHYPPAQVCILCLGLKRVVVFVLRDNVTIAHLTLIIMPTKQKLCLEPYYHLIMGSS